MATQPANSLPQKNKQTVPTVFVSFSVGDFLKYKSDLVRRNFLMVVKESTNKEKRKTPFQGSSAPNVVQQMSFGAQGMPQFWSIGDCRNYGYHGAFILENGNLSKKLQKE